MAVLGAYYQVLKPERTLANVMTTAAGFLLASAWRFDIWLLLATIVGTTLIVASACAVNNATDRGIDARMTRTRQRALVVGTLPVWQVLVLAVVLGIIGFWLLIAYVNWLTVAIGVIGYVDYVLLYSWSKRHTVHSTLIGTISGAAPLVAGYTAVTNRFDLTAVLLALIMVSWQMAHFFAIGVYRRDDYAKAGLPIFSVQRGVGATKRRIIAYIALFVIATALLLFDTHISPILFLVVLPLALRWLWSGFTSTQPDSKWGAAMFGESLTVLLVLSVVLSVGSILP